MNPPRPISEELRPYVDSADQEAFDHIGQRLTDERPIPHPAFRGELQARLQNARRPWRPERLRLAVLSYACSGFLLIGVAALGLTGAGPLAY